VGGRYNWDASSNTCGGSGSEVEIAQLAKSVAVSVNAQKYGGLYFQPIGKVKGIPTSCGKFGNGGKTTASSNAASGDNGMR